MSARAARGARGDWRLRALDSFWAVFTVGMLGLAAVMSAGCAL